MKLSIIIPVYRVEATLDRCIESVLHQDIDDFEVILIDDGSPDNCPKMCDEWALRDAHIRVIHQPNGGLSAARNAGIDAAQGEYITFVDSDDYISPDTYAPLLEDIGTADIIEYPVYKRLSLQDKGYILVLIAASVWSRATRLSAGFRAAGFLRLQLIYMADGIVRYLYGAFMMIALLYGIYLLLKKLLRNEIIPLLVILVLSFFTPFIRIVNDGMMRQGPELRYLQLGPGIPLFPLGMLAMKFKDNILPKTGKGFLTHIVSWVMLGGISFYSLSALQRFLLNRAGLRISDGYSCMPDENFGRTLATLEKIYRLECIPWLVFGFALSMLLFVMISFVRTGNPVTEFCRKNCYLISVLLFSRHIFMVINMKDMSFWTEVVGLKDSLTVIVPFIYFALFAVLSCLVNKILKKHELKKT